MPHEPRSSPHNAETVADSSNQDGPRWVIAHVHVHASAELLFLGRVGPLDLWLDAYDPSMAFLLAYGPKPTDCNWASDRERILWRCKAERIHLTLHDECRIYQLCATHNPNNTMETTND